MPPEVREPVSFEKEEQVLIPTGSRTECIAVSGYANFFDLFDPETNGPSVFANDDSPGIDFDVVLTSSPVEGDTDDDTIWKEYKVLMTVGPKWAAVRDVSPVVNFAGFAFNDSDTADASGAQIDSCTFQIVGTEPPPGEKPFVRIQLIVNLRICGGEQYFVTKLSYHFIAVGRLFVA